MRPILAYSNKALPETADEGRAFINIRTGEEFIFHEGHWYDKKQVILPKEEKPAPAKAGAPKKKTTTKKTPKKEETE